MKISKRQRLQLLNQIDVVLNSTLQKVRGSSPGGGDFSYFTSNDSVQ